MRLLFLLSIAATASAQIGPDYERPATATPPRFKGAVTWREGRPADHLPKGEWWRVFDDAKLDELMRRATANNQQLKVAMARFDQARAAARMARGDLFPTLGATLMAEKQRTSANIASAFPLNGARYDGPSYYVPVEFNWELDLWGKVRRQLEGSRADAVGAANAVHNVLLGIHADIATNYFKLRELDAEMRLVREAVAWRDEAFRIAGARVKAGAGSELEEAQAETEVATAEAEISTLRAQREQLENVIAILVGENAASFRIAARDSALPAPPVIPSGVPSDVIESRPDVAQAERALAAATARIGVAKAYFFPSIRLFGRGGFQSGDIDLLFSSSSLFWNLGPSVTVPIFSGNKNRWNLQKSKAAHDETLAVYRQALLAAFADVEISLSAIRNLEEQAGVQQRARSSAERASSVAKSRYQAGTTPYLDVIDANRTVLSTQRGTAQIAGQRLVAAVALIKALGGGWEQRDVAGLPVVKPDPAARQTPGAEKRGLFSGVKALFKR